MQEISLCKLECICLSWCVGCLVVPVPLAASEPSRSRPSDVVITVKKDRVEFRVHQELATLYHIGKEEAKPYFWPVHAPGHIPVTRAWPMEKGQPGESTDHVHQKSVWFCHGEVRPDGVDALVWIGAKKVDFWSETGV